MDISKECLYQIQALIPGIFCEFVLGQGAGWTAPTLGRLRDESYIAFSITDDKASWIASLPEFSRILVPLLTIPLLDTIGRKGALISATLLCLISNVLIALTTEIPVIYFSRLVFGAAHGVYTTAASLYLCENFKPTYRGIFGTTLIACYYCGTLVEFCLVNYLTYERTAYTNTAIGFLGLFTLFYSVETPEYLLSKGRNEEALKNFLRLRGVETENAALMDEFEEVRKYAQEKGEERPLWTLLTIAAYRKTIIIVLVFNFLASATGVGPVLSYVSITFVEGVLTPTEYTIAFGALQLAAAIVGTVVIENVNRRAFLTFSLVVSVFAHLGTATLFYLEKRMIHVPFSSLFIFSTVTIYSMTFSSCILPNIILVAGEQLPQSVRSFGSGVGILVFALVGFCLTKGFLFISQVFGMYWNFIFFTVVSFVFLLFVQLVFPENRGKSLVDIRTEVESRID